MWGRIILAGLAAAILAGCGPRPLSPIAAGLEGLEPPPGTEIIDEAVDGMLVGHRLMEAQQYELALRAYTRSAADRGLTVETLTALGSANLALGRLGQAEDQFRRAIDEDEQYVPAWNNLGVILMEQGEYGEARRTFETAFALDSGQTDSIRDNLRLAIARMENPVYTEEETIEGLDLIRQSEGVYVLLSEI